MERCIHIHRGISWTTQAASHVIQATNSVAQRLVFASWMGSGVEAQQSVEETVSEKSLCAVKCNKKAVNPTISWFMNALQIR